MRQTIINMYESIKASKAAYRAAEAENNESLMIAARTTGMALHEALRTQDNGFRTMYHLYEKARDNNREIINLESNDCLLVDDAMELVNIFNENEIKCFTMSSTATNTASIAWAFTQQGFKMTGMEMVVTDANATDYEGNSAPIMYPAFVFEKA